jgi:hypothetical protein
MVLTTGQTNTTASPLQLNADFALDTLAGSAFCESSSLVGGRGEGRTIGWTPAACP